MKTPFNIRLSTIRRIRKANPGANLRGANLRYADFTGANLRGANFRGANFRYANLRGANFRGAVGNLIDIKSMQFDRWGVVFIPQLQILCVGCEQHKLKAWFNFSDERISYMDRDALNWWRKWKPILEQITKEDKKNETNFK